MSIRKTTLPWICVLLATSAWSSVFVHWTASAVPPTKRLGVDELVVSWDGGASPIIKAARGQGYRVYAEASPQQAAAAAEASAKLGLAGVILNVRESERREAQRLAPWSEKLRSTATGMASAACRRWNASSFRIGTSKSTCSSLPATTPRRLPVGAGDDPESGQLGGEPASRPPRAGGIRRRRDPVRERGRRREPGRPSGRPACGTGSRRSCTSAGRSPGWRGSRAGRRCR